MALTVTNAMIDGARSGFRAVDGVIEAIGPDVAAEPGDETLDAAGAALTPALVNGHTHAAMTLFAAGATTSRSGSGSSNESGPPRRA